MTATEQALLEALLDLESAVTRINTAVPKPDLMALFSRLDVLTAQLPKSTAPDLLHYLHKRSYQKARLFLQGRDAESQSGACDSR